MVVDKSVLVAALAAHASDVEKQEIPGQQNCHNLVLEETPADGSTAFVTAGPVTSALRAGRESTNMERGTLHHENHINTADTLVTTHEVLELKPAVMLLHISLIPC